MTRDRTGDEADDHECRDGWLSAPDADVAIACPCRWSRTADSATNNDFAERQPSARAAAAIRAEENRT